MGYLDNSSITVDAILTKKGRELLARNDGSFNITQFALGDDEIDYTLFNENHPNGTQYASEAIENMPLIEAIPDGSNMMRSQLITLTRGNSLLPKITVPGFTTTVSLDKGQTTATTITPTTHNLDNSSTSDTEPAGYKFTIVNFNYLTSMDTGVDDITTASEIYGETTSESIIGNHVNLIPTNQDALFGGVAGTTIATTLIIEGMTTGARKSLQVTVTW